MWKKVLFLTFMSFLLLGFSKIDVAEAGYHAWKKIPQAGSTCEVRAWTDRSTYGSSVKTAEFFLESRGNCGRLDYSAAIHTPGASWAVTNLSKGYFSFRTPNKTLNIFNEYKRPYDARLIVQFTKNGRSVGSYHSYYMKFV